MENRDNKFQRSGTPALHQPDAPSLVVVGSIGIDTIETPVARRESILGGSASYACAAASFFTRVGMVGIVGADFPKRHVELYKHFRIDLDGLEAVPGETFRWTGVYEANMDNRRTICTELNVFASFLPKLPPSYRKSPFLFLANIQPCLQLHVLDQIEKARFVVVDTMDLWINTAKEVLLEVIERVDMLTLNESEARRLSGRHILLKAARVLLGLGPKYVLIKKGEHGSILFSEKGVFLMPAYPIEDVQDPTGAGDTFAGGLMGALAAGGKSDEISIRKAMVYGSIVASFGVEAFSLDRLKTLTLDEIEVRAGQFRDMMKAQ
jgi:sugar/nucleoside kinase (ribokinase family)